jgi:adenylate cyclase
MSDIPGTPKVYRRLAAILAADIARYSALLDADEEAAALDLNAHQAVILPMIGEYGGRIIGTSGDGFHAEFSSVLSAVKCALAIQQVMAERNAPVDPTKRMQFRIGINQGDVVFDDTRVHGIGVNVAARLESMADPGGICISGKVHEEIAGKVDANFEDIGQQSLKNIASSVRVYRISRVQRDGPAVVTRSPHTLPGKPGMIERQQRRLAAILAADIAAYSSLMGADEARTVHDLKAHQAVVLPMIGEHGGRIIDTAGDGILAEFRSVVNAVECAVAIQRAMVGRNANVPLDRQMKFRLGVNLGDVIHDDARIYGDGVNIAARLESIADPGGICVSAAVYEQVQKKLPLTFTDLGAQSLKNISEPMRAYRINREHWSVAQVEGRPALPLPDKPSIAVLPFTNLSGDKEQEYFSDGITEDIITELSRFSELFVIARNSSFTYKGKIIDVRQVGRELGVRYVLEGSIRRAGDRVRITAQLIDSTTRAHRWAGRYDREMKDIFAVQDEVAGSTVAILADQVNKAEIERAKRKPTENLRAYDIYLRGLANVYKWTREANEEALRLFYKAIELDPEFLSPYAAAAHCFQRRKAFRWVIDRDHEITEVRRLARQVVQSTNSDAGALSLAGFALANVVMELDEGVALIDRALTLNPNLAIAWRCSGWLRLWLGENDLAIEHFARAMRLSPVDPVMFGMQEGTAHAHFYAGRYMEALSWARIALSIMPVGHAGLRVGAASSALAGCSEEATKMIARLREIDPALRVSNYLTDVAGPYRRPEHVAKFADALRKAGLPE